MAKSQRPIEAAALQVLSLGLGAPLRNALAELLVGLYTKGDNIALYGCVNKLQELLGTGKESKSVGDAGRASLLCCLAKLVDQFGGQLGSGFQESVAIANRLFKSPNVEVREEALLMLASYVSTCSRDRYAGKAQEESLRLAERASRDRAEGVRKCAAYLIAAIADAGGQGFFSNGTSGMDEAVRICLRGIEDGARGVSTAFSDALGQVVSSTASTSATEALGKCKESRRQGLKLAMDNPCGAFGVPFLKAFSEGKPRSCVSVILAWRKCFHEFKYKYRQGDDKLIDFVLSALKTLLELDKAW